MKIERGCKGFMNRGQVIPVIDLRARFGMMTTDVTDQTCIIVVETNRGHCTFSTGIVVDRVQEVLDIVGQDIEKAPEFGQSVNTDFILGMGKIGGSVKILLDIDKVLAGEHLLDFCMADEYNQSVTNNHTIEKKE